MASQIQHGLCRGWRQCMCVCVCVFWDHYSSKALNSNVSVSASPVFSCVWIFMWGLSGYEDGRGQRHTQRGYKKVSVVFPRTSLHAEHLRDGESPEIVGDSGCSPLLCPSIAGLFPCKGAGRLQLSLYSVFQVCLWPSISQSCDIITEVTDQWCIAPF